MNPLKLLMTLPLLVTVLSVVSAYRSGKILNAAGAAPMIASRLENGGAYWFQVTLRIVAIIFLGWLDAQLLFFTP